MTRERAGQKVVVYAKIGQELRCKWYFNKIGVGLV